MPTCKWCDRNGWFLSLSEQGLCKACHQVIANATSQRARIVLESHKIAEQSPRLETALSRCDLAIEHVRALERFERRDIETIRPAPSSLLHTLYQTRERIIANALKREVDAALAKASVAKGTTAKVNALSKVLLRVQGYKEKARLQSSSFFWKST